MNIVTTGRDLERIRYGLWMSKPWLHESPWIILYLAKAESLLQISILSHCGCKAFRCLGHDWSLADTYALNTWGEDISISLRIIAQNNSVVEAYNDLHNKDKTTKQGLRWWLKLSHSSNESRYLDSFTHALLQPNSDIKTYCIWVC